MFNFERLDILRDTIGHPSQKLLSFEFAECSASVFNFERLDIVRGSIRHPS